MSESTYKELEAYEDAVYLDGYSAGYKEHTRQCAVAVSNYFLGLADELEEIAVHQVISRVSLYEIILRHRSAAKRAA